MKNTLLEYASKYLKYLLSIPFFLVFTVSKSQSADSLSFFNNLRLGAQVNYGTIIPHHSSISYVLESNIQGAEILLTTDTYGRTEWDRAFRFPRMGVGYLYSSLGNNEVFGKAHASFLFMDIPFSEKEKKLHVSYQINFGFSYLTETFDVHSNPLNVAISSGLNLYVSFRLNTLLKLGEHSEVLMGASLQHFSNGKIATPNLGLNAFALNIGYKYLLSPSRKMERNYSTIPWTKQHNIELIASGGTKTDDQVTGTYYPISTFVGDYKFSFCRKYAVGGGVDLFYDKSLGPNMVAEQGGSYTNTDLIQLGIHGAFFVRYAKLSIILQLGSYAHANYYKYIPIYTRIGFRYEIQPNLLFNFSLKSHRAVADYTEWGIGYRFNLQKN